MWWHAIRDAWPQYKIPHPDKLSQRVEHIKTYHDDKHNNSLVAFIYARNLLLYVRRVRVRGRLTHRQRVATGD